MHSQRGGEHDTSDQERERVPDVHDERTELVGLAVGVHELAAKQLVDEEDGADDGYGHGPVYRCRVPIACRVDDVAVTGENKECPEELSASVLILDSKGAMREAGDTACVGYSLRRVAR